MHVGTSIAGRRISCRPLHRRTLVVFAAMRIGALDVGSNSLHLLVVEAHPDGTFEALVQEKEMLRLGDVVSREGRLTEQAVEGLLATIRRFRTLATAAGADEMVAKAT